MTSATHRDRCWVLLLIVSALCTKQSFANGQQTTSNKANVPREPMIRIGDQLTLILERLNQLQQQNALLSEEIADMKRYQMESNDNIQRLTEDIAQMKEQFKEDVAETKTEIRLFAINATEKCSDQLTTRRSEISNVTNNMMQIVVDLSHVKTQLQRQRAATDNSSAEISRLVVLIKDQLTQEVHNSVGAIQRQLQQLAEDNTTKAGIEQLAREHLQMRLGLQLSVSDVYQQLQQLNETAAALEASQLLVFCANARRPRDCGDILKLGLTSSGVYNVCPGNSQRAISVYCDMTTDNGGWTVFQRRQDGSENFYRNWMDYANGFGSLFGEFWLGNDNIHLLTNDGRHYKLRVDLGDFNGTTRYAEYADFKIGASREQYQLLSLGAYNGTAGDSLTYHTGKNFNTFDQDNDASCATVYKGAWWYYSCHYSNLNGQYLGGAHETYADGIEWYYWTGYHYSLKFTEMKIRVNN